jgi:Methyltransferase domain
VLQTVRSLLRRKKSFLEIYGRERFSRYGESAVTFWPIVLPLLQSPKSVVDFGSGSCDWLAALRDLSPGIDCLGVDHPDVPTDAIHIPVENFIHADLSQPVNLGRRFDLAICLEVAEHLPSSAAQTLVDTLMRHSDLVLFSAAIPGQRGKGHINLQWPLYWIERFAVGGINATILCGRSFGTSLELSIGIGRIRFCFLGRRSHSNRWRIGAGHQSFTLCFMRKW